MSAGRVIGRYLVGTAIVLAVVVFGVAIRVSETAGVDQRGKADAIIVLGAAQYDGAPSPIFRSRLDHALELYRQGVAPAIVTIGGNQVGDTYTEAGAGQKYLQEQGVPAAALVAVGQGSDTLVSLRAAKEVIGHNNWDSVVLVTDPLHAFRARAMAQDLGLAVQVSSVESGLGTASDIAGRYLTRETLGSLYYLLVGGSSGAGGPVT
ncbi:YdcF family protein [Nakamurella antarctica]|uniref:YdcF family protein n=1 Tax=Nakamurella antarctica TaxID=1902245 RepID=UPI001EF07556|nr:YdcF family protein [Nakamurella antarctica]